MALVLSYWLSDIAIIVAILLSTVYIYFKYQFKTWQRRGIPVPIEPRFPFGNFPGVNHTKSLDQILAKIYAETPNERFVGCYLLSKPIILVRDLELVKNMFVKDFGSFRDRGFQTNKKKNPMTGEARLEVVTEFIYLGRLFSSNGTIDKEVDRRICAGRRVLGSTCVIAKSDILSAEVRGIMYKSVLLPTLLYGCHIFLMTGQEWRNLRIKLTPTFTSSKMKSMFKAVNSIGLELQDVLGQKTHLPEIDIKDFLTRFTIDVYASTAFGVETKTLHNLNKEFTDMGIELSNPSWKQVLKNLLFFVNPKLANTLPIDILPKFVGDFFTKLVKETFEHRKTNSDKRVDFMKYLHDMQDMGYVKDADNHVKDLSADTRQSFNVESAAAQAFIFFVAAYDITATTMLYTLYELAKNQELQKKVQEEVDTYNEKYNGDIPYEAIMEMDLMERVVSESLRKYPVSPLLIRECAVEYQIPNSDVKFMPGDQMWFPVYGYHHDPKYYPDPEKFDPDRFLPEVKATRPFYSYLPFGEGPRNCMGNRFGLMEIKTGLSLIFSRYSFHTTKNTQDVIHFQPGNAILSPKDPIVLKISERQ